MAVKALYALQNGFMGFERTGLFYGERSPERVASGRNGSRARGTTCWR